MRSHLFETIGGLTLLTLSLIATPATAQTVISNETLVTTTFVVNKKDATAKCANTGCRAKTQMFPPIPVTCPAATGQTCTFHISLDAKISVAIPPACNCFGGGPPGFFQFLVDGVAPTIGPTSEDGNYLFEKSVYTSSPNLGLPSLLSYPASVLTTVTNSGSNSHNVAVNFGCSDTDGGGGCVATAHWSTMRVDVFEP
jgi:hypothetical protein